MVATVASGSRDPAARSLNELLNGGEGDAAREAGVQRLAGLRKQLKIFEARFRGENARAPCAADCPFHILDNYKEYRELKAQLYPPTS